MLPLSSRGSLIQVLGTGAQSGYTFAELLDQLLLFESSTGHFGLITPSDRAGDFSGVDSIAATREGFDLFGVTGRVGFQYKFVPSESLPLSKSHKKQIEESLQKFARREDKEPIACWILVTPEDFNKNQLQWLLGLKAKHKIQCDIRHWGQKQLTSLILKHPQCAVHLYPELARGIRPLSFRDMCQRLVDAYGLVDSHSRFHIEPTISDGRTISSALHEFLRSEHNLLCLLGGYGTGKSNAVEHLSLELARAHFQNEGARIPVLIKLRDVRGDASFAHNVITYMQREYGIDVDVTGIKSLNGAGRLVILMDGLDEKEAPSDRNRTQVRLREVFDFISPKGKLLLTSRTEFFRDSVEEWHRIFGQHRPHLVSVNDVPSMTGKLPVFKPGEPISMGDRRGTIIYTAPLSQRLIEDYVGKRLGKIDAPAFFAKIAELYDLSDIVTRPVLLDMVCDILPELMQHEGRISVTDVYSAYITQQLESDTVSNRMSSDIGSKLSAIEEISEQMSLLNSPRINYREILKRISLPLNELEHDFLNTAFLTRDGFGYFQFSHQSFREYFGASRMFRYLCGRIQESALWTQTRTISYQQYQFLADLISNHWIETASSLLGRSAHHSIDSSPVTVKEFNDFATTAGYRPLSSVQDVFGYAAVSWFDAVAYSLFRDASIPSLPGLTYAINEEWPHQKTPWCEIPLDSIYHCTSLDKQGPIASLGGMTVIRDQLEWASHGRQVKMTWVLTGMERHIVTPHVDVNTSRNGFALFRCMS